MFLQGTFYLMHLFVSKSGVWCVFSPPEGAAFESTRPPNLRPPVVKDKHYITVSKSSFSMWCLEKNDARALMCVKGGKDEHLLKMCNEHYGYQESWKHTAELPETHTIWWSCWVWDPVLNPLVRSHKSVGLWPLSSDKKSTKPRAYAWISCLYVYKKVLLRGFRSIQTAWPNG